MLLSGLVYHKRRRRIVAVEDGVFNYDVSVTMAESNTLNNDVVGWNISRMSGKSASENGENGENDDYFWD